MPPTRVGPDVWDPPHPTPHPSHPTGDPGGNRNPRAQPFRRQCPRGSPSFPAAPKTHPSCLRSGSGEAWGGRGLGMRHQQAHQGHFRSTSGRGVGAPRSWGWVPPPSLCAQLRGPEGLGLGGDGPLGEDESPGLEAGSGEAREPVGLGHWPAACCPRCVPAGGPPAHRQDGGLAACEAPGLLSPTAPHQATAEMSPRPGASRLLTLLQGKRREIIRSEGPQARGTPSTESWCVDRAHEVQTQPYHPEPRCGPAGHTCDIVCHPLVPKLLFQTDPGSIPATQRGGQSGGTAPSTDRETEGSHMP